MKTTYTLSDDTTVTDLKTMVTLSGVQPELGKAFSIVYSQWAGRGGVMAYRDSTYTATLEGYTLTVTRLVPVRETVKSGLAAPAHTAEIEQFAQLLEREIHATYQQVRVITEIIRPLEDRLWQVERELKLLKAGVTDEDLDPWAHVEPVPEPDYPETKPHRPWWKVWGWAR